MADARDQFVEILRSRRMMKPGEEWVIDINLARFARELADKLRGQGHNQAASLIAAEAALLTKSAEEPPVSNSGGQP